MLQPLSSHAEEIPECKWPGHLGPRLLDIGDIVLRIPEGQCFEAEESRTLRNRGGSLADPLITGPFDNIRIWHPYMAQLAGVQLQHLEEPYGLSLLIVKDDTTWDKKPKFPQDDWCIWIEQNNLLHLSDIPDNIAVGNGFWFSWKYPTFWITLTDPQSFFGSPIIISGYKDNSKIFNFQTNVPLSNHVRLHLTFDSVDLNEIDIKNLLKNIDQSARAWIDVRHSAPLVHETPFNCQD